MKRGVVIQRPARLSVEHRQLLIQNEDGRHTAPIEDLDVVVLDHTAVDVTGPLLATLGEARVAVVVCGEKHLPTGILLPYEGHTLMAQTLRAQIAAPRPAQKRVWQAIVQEKIRSQARHLRNRLGGDRGLFAMAGDVRSGDVTHREAAAATIYFAALFGPAFARRRGAEIAGTDTQKARIANALLNYGYAVLRAAVARAVVLAGLHPALGVHHRHRENAFALADDLLEPLRVLADRETCAILDEEPALPEELNPYLKRRMLGVLTAEVGWEQGLWPLDAALEAYAAQVRQCLMGERKAPAVPAA
ncbi:MAG: type II CRISPR-associated endonuclease Cas1 [Fimbriimonadaceae bacterium]